MPNQKIRPIAICIFSKNNKILVFEGYDKVKNQTFYRPLGGGIEFGEHSSETIVREIREEIDAEISNVNLLGTFENIFTLNGKPEHEIVLVYKAELCDTKLYEQQQFEIIEENGSRSTAFWKPIDFFNEGLAPLYPNGLISLIEKIKSR